VTVVRAVETGVVAAAAARAAAERVSLQAPRLLDRLRRLVCTDSGRDSPSGREQVVEMLAEWGSEAGCTAEVVPGPSGSTLVLRLQGVGERRVVLLGHHDTVFPAGTAEREGLRVEDGRAYGPGTADMKGGLLLGLAAMECLAALGPPSVTVELHSVPDEESRDAGPFSTFKRIRGADACFVLECAREDGSLVVRRKACCKLEIVATGASAHAGASPEQGRNAVLALCREAVRLDALRGEFERSDGVTLSVGSLHGGAHFATVPDAARMEVDVRGWTEAVVASVLRRAKEIGRAEGVTFDVRHGDIWPAMAPSDGSRRLAETAVSLAGRVGTSIGVTETGGASDGCWTASAGIRTLDGLGPIGGRDHSPDEYIEVASMAERCGVLVGLISIVGGEDPGDDWRRL